MPYIYFSGNRALHLNTVQAEIYSMPYLFMTNKSPYMICFSFILKGMTHLIILQLILGYYISKNNATLRLKSVEKGAFAIQK